MSTLLNLVVVVAFLTASGLIAVLLAANERLRRELIKERSKRREALLALAHQKDVAKFQEAPLDQMESVLVDAGVLGRGGVFRGAGG